MLPSAVGWDTSSAEGVWVGFAAAEWGAVPDGWWGAGAGAIWSFTSPRRESLAHGAFTSARFGYTGNAVPQ